MKLPFVHNLSPALVTRLRELFPGSIHVGSIGMEKAADEVIRDHARDNGFAVVGKDSDFEAKSLARGTPPRGIGVREGDVTTDKVEAASRRHFAAIETFLSDPDAGIYVLRPDDLR